MIDASVVVELGEFTLNVKLTAAPGELVVLVGPNGAGKTTLLRSLAGLQPIDHGRIVIGDTVADDGTLRLAPHRRNVGLMPQRDHLFPHLSAAENVAFGLRRRGVSKRDALHAAHTTMEMLGVADVASLKPASLSGGQARRVALGRAMVIRPSVLLLDEPLAALDASAHRLIRRELRSYLKGHRDAVQIMVTHDPIDALALADRIVVLERGTVVQDVTPDEIRARPRSAYVAEFVGINLIEGVAHGDRIVTSSGAEIVTASPSVSGNVLAVIHPRAVALHLSPAGGSPRNTWSGTVSEVDDEGSRTRVRLEGALPLVAEVTPDSVRRLDIAPGVTVYATVKATEVTVFEA